MAPVGDPAGSYDRILDFSTAVTGTTFFVPSNGAWVHSPTSTEAARIAWNCWNHLLETYTRRSAASAARSRLRRAPQPP